VAPSHEEEEHDDDDDASTGTRPGPETRCGARMRCIRGHVDMATWSEIIRVSQRITKDLENDETGNLGASSQPEAPAALLSEGLIIIDSSILVDENSSHWKIK
jgi:hypothetical protein